MNERQRADFDKLRHDISLVKYQQGLKPWQPAKTLLPTGRMSSIDYLESVENYEELADMFAAEGGYYPVLFELRDFYVRCAREATGVIERVRKL